MDTDELAKEIARRKQAARDLKLRELVWKLYGSYFQYHSQNMSREPGSIHPALKESLSIKDNHYSFTIAGVQFEIVYKQGKEEREGRGFRRREDETVTTPMQFSLEREGDLVFEFKMTKTVTYAEDAPLFSEHLGEITAFIEGPWVADFTSFVHEVDQYRRQYWENRNAEKREQKAKSERKRFGL
jgi:hypothetical protein